MAGEQRSTSRIDSVGADLAAKTGPTIVKGGPGWPR